MTLAIGALNLGGAAAENFIEKDFCRRHLEAKLLRRGIDVFVSEGEGKPSWFRVEANFNGLAVDCKLEVVGKIA